LSFTTSATNSFIGSMYREQISSRSEKGSEYLFSPSITYSSGARPSCPGTLPRSSTLKCTYTFCTQGKKTAMVTVAVAVVSGSEGWDATEAGVKRESGRYGGVLSRARVTLRKAQVMASMSGPCKTGCNDAAGATRLRLRYGTVAMQGPRRRAGPARGKYRAQDGAHRGAHEGTVGLGGPWRRGDALLVEG